MEILVPAYFYPSTRSAWNTLTTSAAANPLVTILAIMNPNDGIFNSVDVNFTRATTQFVAAGGKVLGYVYTGYGKGGRSIADIKLNIDRYLQLYGRERISGFFLDEMASETQRLDFYREIYSYIKSIDPSLRVVGNPGMVPAAQYASVADTLVVFESTASDYQKFDPRPQNVWLYSYANQTQAMLAHNTASCAAMQTAMQTAASSKAAHYFAKLQSMDLDGVTSQHFSYDAKGDLKDVAITVYQAEKGKWVPVDSISSGSK